MSRFFTADEHYGSERALSLSRRPFATVEEMDEYIVKCHNLKVSNDDIVIHNGDFGNYDIVKQLNGTHILRLGNYEIDDIEKKYGGDFKKFVFDMVDRGFTEVIHNNISYITITIDGEEVLMAMTHKPEDCDKDEFNLFAHIHGRQKVKRYGLDVGVDANHFFPMSEDDIAFTYTAIKKYYDNNVFE